MGWDHEKSALTLLRWSLDRFAANKLVLASSFGAEDVVLLDLCSTLGALPRVVTLDTGRLPQETHDVIEAHRRRYGLRVEVLFPEPGELQALVGPHGPNAFYESVDLRRRCCDVRKTRPLRRTLAGAEAWITGLRREQSPGRQKTAAVERDARFGLLKINPLLDWTEVQVWERIRARALPYNRLHDAGYPSVGCAPCTRAVPPGADPRSGRWWWESPGAAKECGLHPGR